MNYFSLPADFRKETIDRYNVLNNTYQNAQVSETYGNITIGEVLESGRQIDLLPKVNLSELRHYVDYSRDRNIDFNYTLNASTLRNREFTQEGVAQIIDLLDTLFHIGVRHLTISLPSLMELVIQSGFDFVLKASTICQITNAAKALSFKELGVDRMVVDESINREFQMLKRIKQQFGENVELIVNSLCHKNCIYRMFHYNQIAVDSIAVTNRNSAEYYSHRCAMRRHEKLSDFLRLCWVRPEDISYYNALGIHNFKLQGRQTVLKGDPAKAVDYYFKGSFDGNLIDLLYLFDPPSSSRVFIDNKKLNGFIKPFVEKENFCRNDCPSCRYCDSFAQRCIDYQHAERVVRLAREFYNDYDSFERIIHEVVGQRSERNQLIKADNTQPDEEGFRF